MKPMRAETNFSFSKMEVVKEIKTYFRRNSCFLLKIILRILSTSFNEEEPTWYKYYSYFVFTVIALYPVSNAINLIVHLNDFDLIAKYLFHVVGGIAGIGKIIVLRMHRKNVGKVMQKIMDLQNRLNVEEWSQNIICNTNRVVIGILGGLSCMTTSAFIVTYSIRLFASDTKQRVLPFSEIAFLDLGRSPSFEIAWLIQCTFIFFAAPGFISSTVCIASLIADLVVQLKILQRRIIVIVEGAREVCNKDNQQLGKEESWFYLQRALKKIVTDHVFLIQLVNDVEAFGNPVLMLDVLSSLVMIAFCVYYYTLVPLTDPRSYQIMIQVTAVVISLFFICFWGTRLTLEGHAVGTACYTSNFLGSDLRFQKGLQMIIMRSDKPMYLTVGKFSMLSVTLYTTIMKNSYTVLMVLRKSKEIE